ncbi:hypothetical protein [Wolbachia endosymbiont of Drosophila tsacasi]|uniref:hypothetical protein n=1 Tax=Wolbachia endosymbiont of Drosophila tsacasi TaxID=3002579 RepID=UPI0023A9DF6A|nr:hypothetical protein [Wolbachia endosymbiont of Drosophila tsacasi]MDE5061692.1 hypothetical protein [Wolbachia endosymbiont of Drosophila tsacasi]
MTEVKDTPQTGVEKKFKDVFERSPGPFPEGASLEDKVQTIAKLNQKLESRKSHAAEKVHQDFERIAELDCQYKGKGIFRSEKVAGPKSDKKLQDSPKKPIAEGKSFEQSRQKETSVQTDTQPSKHIVSPSVSKSSVKEKLNTELGKKDNTPKPQENQKEEGLFSLLGGV